MVWVGILNISNSLTTSDHLELDKWLEFEIWIECPSSTVRLARQDPCLATFCKGDGMRLIVIYTSEEALPRVAFVEADVEFHGCLDVSPLPC